VHGPHDCRKETVMNNEPWKQYEPRRENIIKMFHAAQERPDSKSSVDSQTLSKIAEYLGIPLAEAAGILSFYQTFSRLPRGRHVVRVCDSLSCRIRGSLAVYEKLRERIGIGRGETTPDGLFTLEIMNCLGSCDTAPNFMVDDQLYEKVAPEDVEGILDAYIKDERQRGVS
jgi:NADH:ubiquinone oxidoreductase subunit E